MSDVGDPLTASHAIGAQLVAETLPPQGFHLTTPRVPERQQPYNVTHLRNGSRPGLPGEASRHAFATSEDDRRAW